ncbi:MAG: phosphoribosyltransferase family protein [Candidatus Sulfotelmatobacter sp.]
MTQRPDDENLLKRYSWEDMDRLHREVARQIRDSGYAADVILGIMRCGQIPAIHLSYVLGVRRVGGILVKTSATDAPLESDRIEPELTMQTPEDHIIGKRVLLVDAVMESGTTVELCLNSLAKYRPADVKVAIMVDWYNSSYKIASGRRPAIDFFADRATVWPDFPWEH